MLRIEIPSYLSGILINDEADTSRIDPTSVQDKWLEHELYKNWIAPVKNDNTKAR